MPILPSAGLRNNLHLHFIVELHAHIGSTHNPRYDNRNAEVMRKIHQVICE
jgi:hypothetical protein